MVSSTRLHSLKFPVNYQNLCTANAIAFFVITDEYLWLFNIIGISSAISLTLFLKREKGSLGEIM